MAQSVVFWIGFHLLILLLLLIDMGLFQKNTRTLSLKESIFLSLFWVLAALGFNGFVYCLNGKEAALTFLTGYLIEKSLSIDNLFLFLLIFSTLNIRPVDQKKVFYWGIFGAIVFRVSLILAGLKLVQAFHWVLYVFALFLLFTGVKLLFQKIEQKSFRQSFLYRLLKRILPTTLAQQSGAFFVKERGIWKCTPVFVSLVAIELSDVLFALDSIPAIFAITTDPFLVYTSNIFAILGLRALYLCLGPFLERLRYVRYGLSLILIFIGCKMLLEKIYELPIEGSLGIVILILILTVLSSIYHRKIRNCLGK